MTPETAFAASGTREAAESNLCILVAMEYIEEIVFLILHEEDIHDQTFGDVAGRKNCFFVRLFVKFDVIGRFEFKPISRDRYEMFGPHSDVSNGVEIYNEHMLYALKHEQDNSRSMLFRKGKITGPNKSIHYTKSKES